MNRNFGIGILALCFSSSAVNLGLAAEVMQVSPIIVQPYEMQELNQQMLDRDRLNRDEEIAIQGLIEENNKLTRVTLARQEDEGLKEINQTMLSYRNALLSRDQARIMANSERRPSRYGDLIALTEDVNAMTFARVILEDKSGLLAQKYQMLTALRDEMIALNNKLEGKGADRLNQKETILEEGYKRIAHEQQRKIRMLIGRLDEIDRKISHFDEIIAQKDRQIAQLKDNTGLLKSELENKIKELSANRQNQIQNADLQSRAELLKKELHLKDRETELLNAELKNKIAQQKNQEVLEYRIRDLKTHIQDKEIQIISMKTRAQLGQKIQVQIDTLRRQLADQQNKVDLLKQELDSKTTQGDQMALMLSDYQKKLESKDNAYNEQLRQVLSFKNYQAQRKGQIADLNARLQEKEAQVVKIKKDMYDLRELTAAQDRDLQAKNLSLSTELALARRQPSGMPSRDEIDFLKDSFKKATLQLKQKDGMLLQIKANADEYARKFKEQSQEFQSLKVQLQNAYEEITRLKERSTKSIPPENNNALSDDRLREKLKQALDEIDRQGRVINVLIEKLHDAGQNVDLTKYFAK